MSDRNRAIDALIAEHAMGWTWVPRSDGIGFLLPPCWKQMRTEDGLAGWIYTPTCAETNLVEGFFGEGEILQKRPHLGPRYSTDPAASKQLRDRMRELGWAWQIAGFPSGSGGAKAPWYRARFWTLPAALKSHFDDAEADTEELAVALAVLAALGIEAPK